MNDKRNSNAPEETGAQATDEAAAAAMQVATEDTEGMGESKDMRVDRNADAGKSADTGVSAEKAGVAGVEESAPKVDTNADEGSDGIVRETVEAEAVVGADDMNTVVDSEAQDETQEEVATEDAASEGAEAEDSAAQAKTEAATFGRKAKASGSAKAKADGKAKPSRVRKDIDARKAKKESARDARESDKEEANGKSGRKAKGKSKAERQSFDLDRLEAEAKKRVLTSVAEIDAIGRKTAEHTFDLGRAFEVMKRDIPDETDWKEAVMRLCQISYKSADNWIKVHETLGNRRDDLIRHKVTPTVLITLTRATPEQVDKVIQAFEAGTPMKVREVNDLVKGNTADANADGAPGGGLADLKALARAKAIRQTKAVAANVKAIRSALLEALEAAGTKRLKKGELISDLAPIARITCRDLTELVCEVDPASLSGSQALRHPPPADERWAAALKLVDHLGYRDWAEATVLKAFVTDEVLPTLDFILDGGADTAPKADEVDARNEDRDRSFRQDENDEESSLQNGSFDTDDDVVDDDASLGNGVSNVMPFVAPNGTQSGNGVLGPQASV